MKFKITRSEFDMLALAFEGKKDKVYEINLEPADQTATQAMYENMLKQTAWHEGYHYGYREGFNDGERRRRSCGCPLDYSGTCKNYL